MPHILWREFFGLKIPILSISGDHILHKEVCGRTFMETLPDLLGEEAVHEHVSARFGDTKATRQTGKDELLRKPVVRGEAVLVNN